MKTIIFWLICIKNQDENNNILGADIPDLRFGGVQVHETCPRTEQFKSHLLSSSLSVNGH